MLPRGVGPHLRPQTESSGVVWGRPSPPEPAHAVGALLLVAQRAGRRRSRRCRWRRGAGRTRSRRPPDPRSMNVPAPARCWAQHVHNCLSGGDRPRWWCCPNPLCPMARGRAGQQAGPGKKPRARQSPVGARARPDRGGRDRGVRAVLVRARARGPA